MTRKQFLDLKFPTFPYCEFKKEYFPQRGTSSQFSESVHQKSPNGNCLNFWFSTEPLYDYNNGNVTVSFWNAAEKNMFKKLTNIFYGETITEPQIKELYHKYLLND